MPTVRKASGSVHISALVNTGAESETVTVSIPFRKFWAICEGAKHEAGTSYLLEDEGWDGSADCGVTFRFDDRKVEVESYRDGMILDQVSGPLADFVTDVDSQSQASLELRVGSGHCQTLELTDSDVGALMCCIADPELPWTTPMFTYEGTQFRAELECDYVSGTIVCSIRVRSEGCPEGYDQVLSGCIDADLVLKLDDDEWLPAVKIRADAGDIDAQDVLAREGMEQRADDHERSYEQPTEAEKLSAVSASPLEADAESILDDASDSLTSAERDILGQATKLDLSGVLDPPKHLALCTQVTEVYMEYGGWPEGFTPFAALTQLTRLKFVACSWLPPDLTPLAGLTNLTHILITGADGHVISDLTPLAGLTQLRVFQLESCDSLTDITPLAGLTQLTELDLSGNNELTDLTPLASLTNLTRLCPPDEADLTPLAPLIDAGLKIVSVTPRKSHAISEYKRRTADNPFGYSYYDPSDDIDTHEW